MFGVSVLADFKREGALPQFFILLLGLCGLPGHARRDLVKEHDY